jgi:hypothetical protein
LVDLAHTELLVDLKIEKKEVLGASKGRKEIASKLLKNGEGGWPAAARDGPKGCGTLSVLDPVRGAGLGPLQPTCGRFFEYLGVLR